LSAALPPAGTRLLTLLLLTPAPVLQHPTPSASTSS
jgi:hypothetical protein